MATKRDKWDRLAARLIRRFKGTNNLIYEAFSAPYSRYQIANELAEWSPVRMKEMRKSLAAAMRRTSRGKGGRKMK